MTITAPPSLERIAVVIGMPRAGTTWLYENLKHHPDLCASDYKEINRYLRAMSDAQYLDHFRGCEGRIMLDISPAYYFDRAALGEIAARHRFVILLVREPGEWIESLAAHIGRYDRKADRMASEGRYRMAIDRERSITFDHNTYDHERHLAEVRTLLGSRLLEIPFALLQSDPLQVLKRIERYLGVSDHFAPGNFTEAKVNARGGRVSPLYAFLVRHGVLTAVAPIVLMLLPRKLVHWLRRRFVYGQ
ncbi:MAG: hypothetical protein IPK20_05605 [Betaproteobacteria bacterium]|nr:hypothetical protein [Betaproteobacteria bacterium]